MAGFAWVPVDDIRGKRLISLPFGDRAEPIGADPQVWRELAAACLNSAAPLVVRCFGDSPIADVPEMAWAQEFAWHGTPLTGSLEQIAGSIASRNRRNIRVARRRGVKIVSSTESWAVREFHRLHVQLRKRKYRSLAQPIDFLERLREEFAPHDGFITFLACHDDEIVAGTVYLVWNGVLYYKFSASNLDELHTKPNEAIAWAAIQWATERGFTLLDWGLSDLDQPGLVDYKSRWGATEKRIVTWRSRPVPETDADRLLRGLTGLFTLDEVPDAVSTRAGALLYRYFC